MFFYLYHPMYFLLLLHMYSFILLFEHQPTKL